VGASENVFPEYFPGPSQAGEKWLTMKKDRRIKKIGGFLGMAIGIAFSGFIIGGIMALIGVTIIKNSFFGLGGIVGGVAGLVVGYPIGMIIGIILFRAWLKYNGAIISGVLGGLLGAIIVLVLAVPLKLDMPFVLTLTLYLVFTPLFGTIGFYLGRKRERTQKHHKRQ